MQSLTKLEWPQRRRRKRASNFHVDSEDAHFTGVPDNTNSPGSKEPRISKTESTAHVSDLTSDKFCRFRPIVQNSVLPRYGSPAIKKLKHFTQESEIPLGIKQKKKRFCGKFGSISKLRTTRKGKKCFCDEPASVWPQGITQHRIFIKFFSISLGCSPFFRSYFVLPNFWSLRNLIKQLFHSRLLDMRLVKANSALRASLAIYHLISNERSWNNC